MTPITPTYPESPQEALRQVNELNLIWGSTKNPKERTELFKLILDIERYESECMEDAIESNNLKYIYA